jgi:hypothetical protein
MRAIKGRLYTRVGYVTFVGPGHVVRAWNQNKVGLGSDWGLAGVGLRLG